MRALVNRKAVVGLAMAALPLSLVAPSTGAGGVGFPPTGGRPPANLATGQQVSGQQVLAVASATLNSSGGPSGPGTVSFVNTATGKVTRAVPTATDPIAVALAPSGATAYVAGVGSDTVGSPGYFWAVNVSRGTQSHPAQLCTSPVSVTLSPHGAVAYLLCGYDAATEAPSGSVRYVSTLTGHPGPPIKVAAGPTTMVVAPSGQTAFVLGASQVSELATAPAKLKAAINLQASSIALTPDGRTAYLVGHTLPGALGVYPVDVATGQAGPEIMTGGSVPLALAISPNDQTVWVVGVPDPGLGGTEDTLTTIAVSSNRVDRTINLGAFPGATAWQVAISPDGKTTYALGYGTPNRAGVLVPVNTARGTVGKPIAVGNNAGEVMFSANSQLAYVLDFGSPRSPGGVVPVEVATGRAGPPIAVAGAAQAMALS